MKNNAYKKGLVFGIIILFVGASVIVPAAPNIKILPKATNVILNGAPNTPSQPSGNTSGYICVDYNYSTSTTDSGGLNVSYGWDWDGDLTVDWWTGWYVSNETCTIAHNWSVPGDYNLSVKAKNILYNESNWSAPLNVTIQNNPPNEPSNPYPSNGASDVDIYVTLNWTGGDPNPYDTVTYDVYFGNTSSPPKVISNQTTNSYDSGELDCETTYYWQIVSWDNYDASTAGPIWTFTTKVNSPPNEPSNPYPSNGASDVDIHVTLNWTGGDPDPYDTVTYDVYFGNTSSPPKVISNQTTNSYDPGTLDCETTYYWQIVSWDNYNASTAGPIWNFTTKVNSPPNEPKDPDPQDGATGVDIDADLSWICSDPDGHTLTYDVYLEANDYTPDVLVSNGQSGTSYDPGTLDYEITYYWKIIASDEYNASTEGPVWSFTTEMKPETDLSCNGDLSWTNIEPGSTLTGYFTVENIGEPGSLLDWKVLGWPTWGEWTFSQSSGEDLTPEEGLETVGVTIVAPFEREATFSGYIIVTNEENMNDYCTIDVALTTPKNQQSEHLPFLELLQKLIQKFPLLEHILSLLPVFNKILNLQ